MARRIGPQMKLSRRFGVALFNTAKEAKVLQRRNYPPGQHGPSAGGRVSEYGMQLREKQKAKIMYGLLERQFHKYFVEALDQKGDTGFMLLRFLELRLDNVIYRLGWASTRAQARQIVTHGHIMVNGRSVNIPSYRVRPGETFSIRSQSASKGIFANLAKSLENHEPPSWLELDKTALSGKVLGLPAEDQVERNLAPQLIVEFYSR
jgi:small subunit ribosomal protein S4